MGKMGQLLRFGRLVAGMGFIAAILGGQAVASPFVVFPKAGQLTSADGRFVVRNVDPEGAPGAFVGTFHSLWLTEVATGRSRKLCDYLGVAAVGWSSKDFLIVTQYVGKKNSRALVYSANGGEEPVMLDQPALIGMVPVEMRETLRGNDHVFVEGLSVEGETLRLRVWGYGLHDPNGFRWNCEYSLVGRRHLVRSFRTRIIREKVN